MSPSIALIVSQHTLRESLVGSYRAARRYACDGHGDGPLLLNVASRAGQLLAEHGSAASALRFESDATFYSAGVRSYLRLVLAEERGMMLAADDGREARRTMVTISDETAPDGVAVE